MKIVYLSFSYIPSQRANSVHVMKMCRAMADLGHDVTLVGKRIGAQAGGESDDFELYGVPPSFALRKLARPALPGGELVYALAVARFILRSRQADLFYCRYLPGAWLAARLGLPTAFEMHGLAGSRWSRALVRGILGARGFRRLVLLSAGLEKDMAEAGLLPARERYLVAHDGADPAPRSAATEISDEPRLDKAALGYVGGFYRGRGLELMAQMAVRLPQCTFHLVGGGAERLGELLGGEPPPNMVCHGYVAHGRVGEFFERCDILLLPMQQNVEVAGGGIDTGRWMSPLKMFEYMATGKPIICSDLPVLKEIMAHERNALLAPPTDLPAWVAAVLRLLADPPLGRRLGSAARRELEAEYTWASRARNVLQDLVGSPTAKPGRGPT